MSARYTANIAAIAYDCGYGSYRRIEHLVSSRVPTSLFHERRVPLFECAKDWNIYSTRHL